MYYTWYPVNLNISSTVILCSLILADIPIHYSMLNKCLLCARYSASHWRQKDEEHGLWPGTLPRSSGEDTYPLQFDRYCNGNTNKAKQAF